MHLGCVVWSLEFLRVGVGWGVGGGSECVLVEGLGLLCVGVCMFVRDGVLFMLGLRVGGRVLFGRCMCVYVAVALVCLDDVDG